MCAIQQDVERTIDALVSSNQPFTAYNVTTILRNLQLNERHSEIRRVVHKYFDNGQMGSYMQEMVTLPLAQPVRAYCFHPATKPDGSNFDPHDAQVLQGLIGASSATPTATPTPPAVPSAPAPAQSQGPASFVCSASPRMQRRASNSSKTIKVNDASSCLKSMGTLPGSTLYIPKVMAKAIGAPSVPAYISLDPQNNKISICAATTGIPPGHKKACVDRNNNIRIGKTALLSAGLNGQIKVELDGQEIKISKG